MLRRTLPQSARLDRVSDVYIRVKYPLWYIRAVNDRHRNAAYRRALRALVTPGTLVLEAGAVGLPVVATAVGGVPECVVDGETGLLVAPGDHEGGGAAVAALLADPERRRAMGSAARQWIADRYQIDTVAGRYLEFYARALARRRNGRATPADVRETGDRGSG